MVTVAVAAGDGGSDLADNSELGVCTLMFSAYVLPDGQAPPSSDLCSDLKALGDAKAPPFGWKPLTPEGFTGEWIGKLSTVVVGTGLNLDEGLMGLGFKVTSPGLGL